MQETCTMILTTHVSQVVSSVIAAWADISDALTAGDPAVVEAVGGGLSSVTGVVSKLNVGYFWMFLNCITSAAFVSIKNARFLFFSRQPFVFHFH